MSDAPRRPRGGRRAALVGAALALLSGCAGAGLPPEELPAAPIAFRYRTPEEAEKLALVRER
ncbi:MAG: hypothetical protein R3263_11195, partial [Myxococcota bacterium]|nr:hypothetical protein [Myxococcota bacterium]